jgi:hypothetical protein
VEVGIVLAIACAAIALRVWLGQNIMKNTPTLPEVLGRRKLVIDVFKSGVLYRNGVFEKVLPTGVHWVNTKDIRVIAVEMRPQVLRMAEVMATSDRRRVRLSMLIRLQIADARAAVESAANFHDEHVALVLAAIRKLALAWSFRDLNIRPAEFSEAGHAAAGDALKASGGRCISFELLEVESLGELPETDDRDIGFKTN